MPKLQFHCSTFKARDNYLRKRSIPAPTPSPPENKQKVSVSVNTPHFKPANAAIAYVKEPCEANELQSSEGASDCPPGEHLESPSAARQELLIARFAGTIVNAKNKILQLDIDQGKVGKLTEMQKLQKHQKEARYLMDAQLKVSEDATKKRRAMEREAIDKMEEIAKQNLEAVRETEEFMNRMQNVSSEELRKLGLFLKVDDLADFEISC